MNARTWTSGLIASAMVLSLAGGALAQSPHKAASPVSWMTSNPGTKTVDLTLNAGYAGANSGMDFNGYARGQMTVDIPQGWTVDVSFVNSGALPHSAVIEPFGENINSQSPKPAFAGAETPNGVSGLAPGAKASFHFKAATAGKYRIVCAFPGHAQLGMWDTLMIEKGLKAPAISGSGHKLAVRTIAVAKKPVAKKPVAKKPVPKKVVTSALAAKWLKTDAKTRTVTFLVNAGYQGVNSGMDFNGYANGKMVVDIPLGWTVDVSFVNSGALPHSVVFEPWNENINSQSPKPAFAGAETPNGVAGLAPGAKASFHFKAAAAGKYRFLCAFPGHAQLGMWDTMIVQKGLKAPNLTA